MNTRNTKRLPARSLYKSLLALFALILIFSLIGVPPVQLVQAADPVTFGIISDFGYASNATTTTVANVVNSWNPDFIVTAGDNNQGGSCDVTCYQNVVGAYYGPQATPTRTDFITPNPTTKFFPVPGNHDYSSPIANYQTYFSYLPPAGVGSSPGSTSLYYDFVQGPIHFFMLDSGSSSMPNLTAQQTFLQNGLAASTSPWDIVVFHRPAYSGGMWGGDTSLQWDFAGWGADFVVSGHNHVYERIRVGAQDLRYFTTGTAGGSPRTAPTSVAGATLEASAGVSGALRVVASDTSITFEYRNSANSVLDTFTQTKTPTQTPTITTSTASLAAFSTTMGTPSAAQTYTVSGSDLTANISISAPSGFEISTNGSTYSSSLSLTQSGGTVPSTTIYARLTGAAVGAFSGNITHTSAGAAAKDVAVSGSVTAAPTGKIYRLTDTLTDGKNYLVVSRN
ncbi:MAG: hypothetical protein B6D39_06185, partial [Anaerolineae bacterium UTCFX2]